MAVLRDATNLAIGHFDGIRFRLVQPAWGRIRKAGWGVGQIALEDRAGGWWIATGDGLARFSPVQRVEDLAAARPKVIFTTHDGLPGERDFPQFAGLLLQEPQMLGASEEFSRTRTAISGSAQGLGDDRRRTA